MSYDVSKTSKENLDLFLEQSLKNIQPYNLVDNTFVSKKKYEIDDSEFPKVNLKGTKKPQPPKPIQSISTFGNKSSIPYQYSRYEGKFAKTNANFPINDPNYSGYTTYQFYSSQLPKYTKLYHDDLRRWEERYDPIGDFILENYHGLMDIASLGLSFLGPEGLAVATGLDVVNAEMYREEGNTYEAGLRYMFLLIPFHQLTNIARPVEKLGEKGFKRLLLKANKGGILTKAERDALESLEKNSKWIKSEITQKILEEAFNNSFKSLPNLVRFVWILTKKYPKLSFLLKLGIQIKGIEYTWEQLADIFGISNPKKIDEELKKLLEGADIKEANRTFAQALKQVPEVTDIVHGELKLNK